MISLRHFQIYSLIFTYFLSSLNAAYLPQKNALLAYTKSRSLGYDKRSAVAQQPDEEVFELDQLKKLPSHNEQPEEKQADSQLESELLAIATLLNKAELEKEEPVIEQAHTIIPDTEKTETSNTDTTTSVQTTSENSRPTPKQYHGAARLTFGQNPEIAAPPTSTTQSTTTLHPTIAMNVEPTSSTPSIPSSSVDVNLPIETTVKTVSIERRTQTNVQSKANRLLTHSGGQYSAFDMAQYVFWTGDEEGVAKTVEEFIEKGLMSRENALKFLRDISTGIQYLDNIYSIKENPKTSLDDSLKLMFSKSLLNDPKEPHVALQRIIKLLESESANGRISPEIQKKILDVLLHAISDCLTEHPELLSASWEKDLIEKNETQ